MPVRFRCNYCNQLLGIAHRKSGQVVRCPTCSGQVVVPQKSTEDNEKGTAGAAASPLLFERNDFDELLNVAGAEKRPRLLTSGTEAAEDPSPSPSPEGAWGTHAEPAFDLERLHPQPVFQEAQEVEVIAQPIGIVLSPTLATALTVIVIVLLAIAFGAGVLVDRLLL